MTDREKTSYRLVCANRLHPVTQSALSRLKAHQHRMAPVSYTHLTLPTTD